MAKKKNKFNTILNRAQKLFNAENYLQAEKEFEKLPKKLHTDEIIEKLNICREKSRFAKGKILVKQAHKAINANALKEAISCFKQAQELLDEPELAKKIQELEQKQEVTSFDEAAIKAEESGDYAEAAALYEGIWQKSGNQKSAAKSGICYVKAGCEDKAITIFRQSEPQDRAGSYYYGFALAKNGQYPEALIQWEKIDSREKKFIDQKKQVSDLAFPVIYLALQKDDQKDDPDIQKLHDQAAELKEIAHTLGLETLENNYESMLSYCKLILIEDMWDQEDYSGVAKLMEQLSFSAEPAFVALKAKLCYHLSINEKSYLQPMVKSWFDAIIFENPESGFSANEEEQVYQRLNRLAEHRINEHSNTQTARRAAALLDIEKKLITDLKAISKANHNGQIPILTPYSAAASGQSQSILAVIRQNKSYFKDQEHYLEAGGYYTHIWKSLYELRAGDPEKAYSLLESTDAGLPKDEFIDYVVGLVGFEFGRFCLERGDKKYSRYFASAHTLFKAAPSIEKRFTDRFVNYYGDYMAEYETVLKLLYEKRPSSYIARAYSTIMGRMSIKRYNSEQLNNKQLAVILEKALEIYPENELARQNLRDTVIEIQRSNIVKAMTKRKMKKAATIVLESEYPEVEDYFFSDSEEWFDIMCSMPDSSSQDKEILVLALNGLLSACEMVAPYHPLIRRIDDKLARLKGD
jgi:hypothetical protein